MKRYDEYTPEEIEDLARECERLAEENGELCELIDSLKEILLQLIQEHGLELITNLRHSVATPRKGPLDTELPF